MANRKKEVYKPKPMTEGKRNLIQGLLQEYDIQSADDIQEALKDLLVYDLLNCLILDYTNCPKTAQFCVHNSPLVSPECSLRRYYFIQPIR